MRDLVHLAQELENWRNAGTYQSLTILNSEQGSQVEIGNQPSIQLSSNNYLGLTSHPAMKQAAIEAIEEWGVGTGSVRTIAGTFSLHEQLEHELASFKQTEAALVFQSGFTANVGVLASILDERDVVISDELNHASIIDGIRLTKAAKRIYRHVDLGDLERALQENQQARIRLVVTDGVFSMDGDIAPLPEIVEQCEKYGAIIMVDDAHASGVLGRQGRGTVDHFGLHGRVAIQVGTLSKAIGVLGGYVAGSQHLREYLIHRARPFLFSTSHPPSVTASCLKAIQLLQTEEHHIEKLWENTAFFKQGLLQLGFDIGVSKTPITPIMIGNEALAVQMSARLFKEGVYAKAIVYPTVSRGNARIRTIVTAQHSIEELEKGIEMFAKVGKELEII
ncbi:glycine C-acetyltransferase [Seinonella peptonophila]|uniref:8-amino-7-ketopelargonate synthase n=1 Tax=Seinonella peptonophila TaxID=112248 RepID=A0A1M4T9A0_9BACL|nr:glycine C-acetyltransferase [Seinonella peptonophila]SHE41132.1 glycine C-acetyltransferase [Seinonella peptonophila]